MCTHKTIKAIIQHRQEYQHQSSTEEKTNNIVNVAGKPSIRITIVEDVVVGTNIPRPPHGNQEKQFKNDLAKQDLEDRTYKTVILHASMLPTHVRNVERDTPPVQVNWHNLGVHLY
jgi:hypothetical protein